MSREIQCDACGSFGAFELDDQKLCEECFRACGSCCLEFGGHDLWEDGED